MDGYTCEECSKLDPPLHTNTTTALSFARHTRAVLSTYLPTYLHVGSSTKVEFPQTAMTTSYYKSRCEGPAAQIRCPMMLYLG